MIVKTPIAKPSTQDWVQDILKKPSQYETLFVVHNDKNVLFSTPDLNIADDWLTKFSSKYENNLRIFLVPNDFGSVRLRMLKIKSLSAGEWMPTFEILFYLQNGKTRTLEMLVDSGADVTFIPYKIGKLLGFEKSYGETLLFASGVGSKVPYLVRESKIKIGEIDITIRLLWGQDESVTDILLGRLDVFDNFDVTISQYRQKIIFEPVLQS